MNNFTSFKNWLFEKKKARNLEYGCVMLYPTSIPNWNKHVSIIDKEDIYDNDTHDYGLEKEPHITVLYGIHIDETDPKDIKEVMETFEPQEITIDEISIFSNDWNDYDVVKYNVPAPPELRGYNKLLKNKFPFTSDFPKYNPHITIGYVKKDAGKKYVGKVKSFKVKFDKAVYSYKEFKKDKERKKIIVKL